MFHYTGSYYCTRSNWDGQFFEARNLVVIDRIKLINNESETIKCPDFAKLVTVVKDESSNKEVMQLKQEVLIWLHDNVSNTSRGSNGWCMGSEEYRSGVEAFNLFFYRRKDARSFIQAWSDYNQPTGTYNQDTYVEKRLDEKTNRLKKIER